MSKVVISIRDNEGYSANQVSSRITLGDLANEIEQAISLYGEDAELVTFNLNNPNGASWGTLDIDHYAFCDVDEFEKPDSMW